ncbi:MAG: hypothetical protein IJ057_12325 [Bacteroidales bacterium]|nr:hypothetical protein [Bacteroidales bacterium]
MKKLIAIAAALMIVTASATAQVFINDDEFNNQREEISPMDLDVDLPGWYNSGNDWYAPVGSGIAVLAGLAGAYLIGKRRKEE